MYRALSSRPFWRPVQAGAKTLNTRTLGRATPLYSSLSTHLSTKRFIESAAGSDNVPHGDTATNRPTSIDKARFPSPSLPVEKEWRMPSLSFLGSSSTPPTSTTPTDPASRPGDATRPEQPTEDQVPIKRSLPPACTGCGAFTQTKDAQHPGYFDTKRKSVRRYLGLDERPEKKVVDVKENHQVMAVINQIGAEKLKQLGIDPKTLILEENPEMELKKSQDGTTKPPLCDRCHVLIHHHVGQSIFHPTVHALHETLDESPWKYNHVFHVIDAADFPMSLVPRLHQLIGDIRLRTRNRRSMSTHFQHDRAISMSFVITRSDLLAPKKEQVDALMPYLREVLREALGRVGRMVRLGNMWCVSSKRAWWTPDLREEIYKRGGASWLIGKINVGKSQLFESVFPKGRLAGPSGHAAAGQDAVEAENGSQMIEELDPLKVGEWLPPARKEEMYPAMPTVSDVAGTTASPIRIPFGGGKGELIDLPGLARTTLTNHVMTKYRNQLIMKSRIVPEQLVIKSGQSLMVGGMFRFTPRSPDVIILAYNFTPMEPHITHTQKAIEVTEQRSDLFINNIAVPGVGSDMQLAGSFELRYDVTKERAGPLTRRNAVNFKVSDLPFRVLSIDILIESVGWVELVAQVRTRSLYNDRPASDYEERKSPRKNSPEAWDMDASERPPKAKYTPRFKGEGPWHPEFSPAPGADPTDPWASINQAAETSSRATTGKQKQANARFWDTTETGGDVRGRAVADEEAQREDLPEPNWPVIDVFSPHGHFIGARRPMNGWMLNKPLVTEKQKRSRPRKSMKGEKKKSKRLLRMAKSTYFTG
ncbi:hypothetical protein BROUX41_000297 [Berkeleyomyces rouxiae]|uniref:uncharacterized protein n=1 Tax=Berkeleyomyces rouxiae TaxID=2035830 RepID=UPI003B7A6F21